MILYISIKTHIKTNKQ